MTRRRCYFSFTFTTRRQGCVSACSGRANVVGRKARDPATTNRVSPTSVSFHTLDVTTDEHRTHASA
jgi:hypothetical protein